jgi:UDP-N-acetyl-D-mannosaminuronate dehydrogenase
MKQKKTVAIIGNGWVGKAMQKLFSDALVYVKDPNKIVVLDKNRFTNQKEQINQCDIAFICVPTPAPTRANLIRL